MISKIYNLLIILCLSNGNIISQNNFITNDFNCGSIRDTSGINSKEIFFNPKNLYQKKDWIGKWIWLNKKIYPDYQKTYSAWINSELSSKKKYRALFRKKINLTALPQIAVLNISGDVSYRAYLNNELVSEGPPNIGSDYEDKKPPEHWFFTSHNIQNKLKKDENILAVEVFSFDKVLSETTSGSGKFICDLDTNFNKVILSTDSSWKCILDTSYINLKNIFTFNSNYEFENWRKLNYDDRNWYCASTIEEETKKYLEQSKIQIPSIQEIIPLKIVDVTHQVSYENINDLIDKKIYKSELNFDLGKNISGYYSFTVKANKNDTIKFFPIEKNKTNRPFIYICKEGINNYSIPYLNVFRYLKVEIKSNNGLEIKSINIDYSSYPITNAGNFECSDTNYSQLWDIARNTTQMCMQSLYLDSPLHQEPIACTGDYLIETLSNYYAFGDKWLARQDLIKTAKMLKKNNYDMFHTSYSLLWVQWLADYFKYTADTALVQKLIVDVNNLNKLFETYLDENYLLTQAPDYMFMDWIKIGEHNAHHPPAVIGTGYLTAFYYKSLIEAAKLNQLLGNDIIKNKNLLLAEKIKTAFNLLLWDKQKELYKDGNPFQSKVKKHFWLPEDEDITTYSPHVNTLAVLYGIAPVSKQESIMKYVINQNEIELQPYFTYYVLSAIAQINKFNAYGLNLLNKWTNGIDFETYTLKENWQNETEFGYVGDYSHAWGGSPLFFLSSLVLGIVPNEPGYKTIRFTPFVSDKITWAKGKIPIDGENKVEVSWNKNNNIFKYEINIPKNYTCILVHPKEFKDYLFMINNLEKGNADDVFNLSSGKFIIEYKKPNFN